MINNGQHRECGDHACIYRNDMIKQTYDTDKLEFTRPQSQLGRDERNELEKIKEEGGTENAG